MSNKWTPHPWRYDSNISTIYGNIQNVSARTRGNGDFQGCAENSVNEICTVNFLHVYGREERYHDPRLDAVQRRVDAMGEANAHLITASPALYQALAECLSWHDYSDDLTKPAEIRAAYMRARRALANARGEFDE